MMWKDHRRTVEFSLLSRLFARSEPRAHFLDSWWASQQARTKSIERGLHVEGWGAHPGISGFLMGDGGGADDGGMPSLGRGG